MRSLRRADEIRGESSEQEEIPWSLDKYLNSASWFPHLWNKMTSTARSKSISVWGMLAAAPGTL